MARAVLTIGHAADYAVSRSRAPGTRLADIPEDWYGSECGVTKLDFEPLEF